MYINVRKHILSNAILGVALVKILAAFLEFALRLILRGRQYSSPDMLDAILWNCQLAISGIQIIVTAFIFYYSWKKLNHYIKHRSKGGSRQVWENSRRSFLGDKIASLSVSSVKPPAGSFGLLFSLERKCLYVFTSIMYRRFIGMLDGMPSPEAPALLMALL
ncbi:hypothetical protein [Butyrivibrio sp. FCS014]|uniref:hypothetical protein n=1 Tax=Butyrivibrio sp. FCS014 TaxID=1408304 RepID=UPI0004672248|nr:hypothetical protein [Butyrivibrio sp. FCS014]